MPPALDALRGATLWDVAAVLIAVGVVVAGLKWLVPIGNQIRAFLDDWAERPARPGVPAEPGVMERLASYGEKIECLGVGLEDHRQQLEEIRYHTQPNHGGSAYDAMKRAVDDLRELVTDAIAEIGELRRDYADELRANHPDYKPRPRTPSGATDD